MEKETYRDRVRGSLIGGATGDALGYAVEFVDFPAMQRNYGPLGITEYDLDRAGLAIISDDTQMTMFTANGLSNAVAEGTPLLDGICEAYIEWYFTQVDGRRRKNFSKCHVGDIPSMNERRAPGNTCMTALNSLAAGKVPRNNSKGCGGVMRIAPIPLYGAFGSRLSIEEADRLAADASQLTHQHPMGYIPSALIAHIIYRLALTEKPKASDLEKITAEALDTISFLWPGTDEFLEMVENAVALAKAPMPESADKRRAADIDNIENHIGGGWVGDEAAAIAVYCALRYFDDFDAALQAAVNHAGDSDSTGAVTGNILGAAIGYSAIPRKYKSRLEHHDTLLQLADDLVD